MALVNRESTDELRHLDSKDATRVVLMGRQHQVEEKKIKKMQEEEEEKYFASLLEQEKQLKLEKDIYYLLFVCLYVCFLMKRRNGSQR